MLAGIERTAGAIGQRVGVTVGAIRMGTVLGPHVPSPLGRLLRMPAVPFSVLADPPFAVVEDIEVRPGLRRRRPAPPGRAGERRRQRRDHRAAGGPPRAGASRCPLVGPDWRVAQVISGLLGAPIPDHVIETLHRGRLADNARMGELLGFTPTASTWT